MAYTVLVVDDSSTTRAVLERAMKMTGLPFDSIIHAVNGSEAMAVLGERWIDMVFTDINMPQMNGVELIDRMKENPELNEIPVVVVSTEGSTSKIRELESRGIKGYLRKPFTPEDIRDVIVRILGDWNE